MDIADHFWPGQRKQITIVQKALGRVLESFSSDIRFRHAIAADGRAHRPVDNGNSTVEDLFQRVIVHCLHVSLMTLGTLRLGLNAAILSARYACPLL